jgi:hypothetical protein
VEDGVTFVGKVEVNPSGTAAKAAPESAGAAQDSDLLGGSDDTGERGSDKKRGSSLLGRK